MHKIATFIILFSSIVINHSLNAQHSYLLNIGLKDSLYSEKLQEYRDIFVVLPESYSPGSLTKYPVVFVLDGDVLLDAVSTTHNYYWGGFIPEMIIIGISNNKNRTRDLTTSEIKMKQGMQFNQESGRAEYFAQFIEDELIPYVENTYPVTPYRTLIGHSYGGLFAVNMLIHHTDLFVNYLLIDPSLDWDDQKLLKESRDVLASDMVRDKSIYISLSGQLHMQNKEITIDNVMQDTSEYTLFARSNIEFSKFLEKSGLNNKWKYYPNELHGSVPLPSTMDGLLFLFNWYPIKDPDMFNRPDTPTEKLVMLIREREETLLNHFGYKVPPLDEDLLNMLGYMNLDWGNNVKAHAFFELNIEYYPESANVYDSMADYYEIQGDLIQAIEFEKKAFEISGLDSHKFRIENLEKRL